MRADRSRARGRFEEGRRRVAHRVRNEESTRQLGPGDLILGWVCKDQGGTITLEGGLAHVPSLAAEPILSLVAELRQAMPPLADDEATWKRRAAELPVPLLAGILELRANPPMPTLLNTSGEPLEVVTGYYRVLDRERVLAQLPSKFEKNGDGSYTWVDDADIALARLELSASILRVHVNSRKRLKAVQQRLEELLGDAIERSLDAHQDLEQAVRTHKTARKSGAAPERLELRPELAAQFHEIVLKKIRSTLDEPIPQFRNKTLRQLARSEKGRHDAVSWLREQERLLKSNPQLAGLDMRPLWQELALPYQGLDTDPSI